MSAHKRQECKEQKGKYRASGAPKASATCFRIGHTLAGRGGHRYRIVKAGRSRRWAKVTADTKKTTRLPKTQKKPGLLATISARQSQLCAAAKGKFRASGAPKASATCFRIGHREKGRGGAVYKITKSGKTRRWAKA